jgi:hypothetical protein
MSRRRRLFIASAGCVALTWAGLRGPGAIAQGALGRDGIVTDHASQSLPARNTDDSESASRKGGVHALFDLHHPETGPFPSDIFTVADRAHNTGRRVNLPYPDCAFRVSDCEDLDVINTLDGFGLQTRLSIPFDGPIDVHTATSETVFLIRLGSTLRREKDDDDKHDVVQVIGINQVVWDVASNTLHVECDELLAQHTRYALIVTTGLRDAAGRPVEAIEAFRRFRQTVRGKYKHALLEAIHAARRLGVRERHIATASVYTTQSVTSVMERIRDQIKNGTPAGANFLLGPNGERAAFNVADVSGIVSRQHTTVNPPGFTNVNLEVPVLQVVPGAVGTFASGSYFSPDYQVHPGEYFPAVGTRTGTPQVQRYNTIHFSVFLPSGAKPPAGWPVVIVGHGSGSGRHGPLWRVASKLAAYGIASVGINGVGFGFGPSGSLTINLRNGSSLTIPDEGRSLDQNGNNLISNGEGSVAARPRAWTIGERDGYKQSAVDLMQLVRVIEVGIDVDDDRSADLDPGRIYYLGNSAGERYGSMLLALDPSVSAGVLTVAGGMSPEHGRWAPGRRAGLGNMLGARAPSLLNSPGIAEIDGVAVNPPHFDENKPLRNQPPVTNMIIGAMEIQRAFEMHEWGQQLGQTSSVWARHLRESPLPGLYPKSLIIQFARGDQQGINPGTTALLRAGNLADRAVHYRHDLAFGEDGATPKNPHDVMVSPMHPNATFRSISRGMQDQIGEFFASGGTRVIHPEPARFFDVPLMGPLPEDLNYIR